MLGGVSDQPRHIGAVLQVEVKAKAANSWRRSWDVGGFEAEHPTCPLKIKGYIKGPLTTLPYLEHPGHCHPSISDLA